MATPTGAELGGLQAWLDVLEQEILEEAFEELIAKVKEAFHVGGLTHMVDVYNETIDGYTAKPAKTVLKNAVNKAAHNATAALLEEVKEQTGYFPTALIGHTINPTDVSEALKTVITKAQGDDFVSDVLGAHTPVGNTWYYATDEAGAVASLQDGWNPADKTGKYGSKMALKTLPDTDAEVNMATFAKVQHPLTGSTDEIWKHTTQLMQGELPPAKVNPKTGKKVWAWSPGEKESVMAQKLIDQGYDSVIETLPSGDKVLHVLDHRIVRYQSDQVTTGLMQKYKLGNAGGDTLANANIYKALSKGAPDSVVDAITTMKDSYGMTYSERIWRQSALASGELVEAVQEKVGAGASAVGHAKDLIKFQVDDRELPRHLKRLEQKARIALSGAPKARREFLEELKRARREIAKRKGGPLGTRGFQRKLAASLEKAVKNGTEEAIDAAIDRVLYDRAKYRAKVLLRSETNRAYQLASMEVYGRNKFVQAVKWCTSMVHLHIDECDLKANVDPFGLGPGTYPKGFVPWPDHPNGLCHLRPVLPPPEGMATAEAFIPDNPLEASAVISEIKGEAAAKINKFGAQALDDDLKKALQDELVQSYANKTSASLAQPTVRKPRFQPEEPDFPSVFDSTQLSLLDYQAPPALEKEVLDYTPFKIKPLSQHYEDEAMDRLLKSKLGGATGARQFRTTWGQDVVIKTDRRIEQVYAEVMANHLYNTLEIPAAKAAFVLERQGDNLTHLAGEWITNPLVKDLIGDRWQNFSAEIADSILDGYVADVWLMSRDALGVTGGFDNVMWDAARGRVIRIDNGNTFKYSFGATKPERQWGVLSEWEGFTDAGINRHYAKVWQSSSYSGLDDPVFKAKAIEQINDILDLGEVTNGYADLFPVVKGVPASAREEMIELLRTRADLLEKEMLPRLGGSRIRRRAPEPEVPEVIAPPPLPRVSDGELRGITRSRQNGYSLIRDARDIEDQSILFWHGFDEQGEPVTKLFMKVREGGAQTMADHLTAGGGLPKFNDLDLHDHMVSALRNVLGKVERGEEMTQQVIDRVDRAKDTLAKLRRDLQNKAKDASKFPWAAQALTDLDAHIKPWMGAIDDVMSQAVVGQKLPATSFPYSKHGLQDKALYDRFDAQVWAPQTQSAITFAERDVRFRASRIERGYQYTETGDAWKSGKGRMFMADVQQGDVELRYFDDSSETLFALRNRLEMETAGHDMAAVEKLLDGLDELGINTTRAGMLDQEELYLTQIAYRHVDGFKDFEKLTSIDDQADRVEAMAKWLDNKLGTPVRDLPNYNPSGRRSAWGTGNQIVEDPSMYGKDWDKFIENTVLQHSLYGGSVEDNLKYILDSGGMMAPSTDKLRRGIRLRGMSPEPDLGTGGGSYFFTRIRQRGNAKGAGIYWRGDHLRRLDAISYQGDMFGKVSGDFVLQNRKSTLQQLEAIRKRHGSDETIFKKSMSIFDDVDFIRADSDYEVQSIIDLFKAHKMNEWPDGRPLDEVIIGPRVTAPKRRPSTPIGGEPDDLAVYLKPAGQAQPLPTAAPQAMPTPGTLLQTPVNDKSGLPYPTSIDDFKNMGPGKFGDQFHLTPKVETSFNKWLAGDISDTEMNTIFKKAIPSKFKQPKPPMQKKDVVEKLALGQPVTVDEMIYWGEKLPDHQVPKTAKQAIKEYKQGKWTKDELEQVINLDVNTKLPTGSPGMTPPPAGGNVIEIDLGKGDEFDWYDQVQLKYANQQITLTEKNALEQALIDWEKKKLTTPQLDQILNPHKYGPGTLPKAPDILVDLDQDAPDDWLMKLFQKKMDGDIDDAKWVESANAIGKFKMGNMEKDELNEIINGVPIPGIQHSTQPPTQIKLPASKGDAWQVEQQLDDMLDNDIIDHVQYSKMNQALMDWQDGHLDTAELDMYLNPQLFPHIDQSKLKPLSTQPPVHPAGSPLDIDLAKYDLSDDADILDLYDKIDTLATQKLIDGATYDFMNDSVLDYKQGHITYDQLNKNLNPHQNVVATPGPTPGAPQPDWTWDDYVKADIQPSLQNIKNYGDEMNLPPELEKLAIDWIGGDIDDLDMTIELSDAFLKAKPTAAAPPAPVATSQELQEMYSKLTLIEEAEQDYLHEYMDLDFFNQAAVEKWQPYEILDKAVEYNKLHKVKPLAKDLTEYGAVMFDTPPMVENVLQDYYLGKATMGDLMDAIDTYWPAAP